MNIGFYFSKIIFLRKIRNFWQKFVLKTAKITLIFMLAFAVSFPSFLFIFYPNIFNNYKIIILRKIENKLNLSGNFAPQIIIYGTKRINYEKLEKFIYQQIEAYHYSNNTNITQFLSQKILENWQWVEKITIQRFLPNKFEVKITEYQPFVIWQNQNESFVVDKSGKMIKITPEDNFNNQAMIILSGENAQQSVASLFNIFVINSELSKKIYSATWINNRRWDIRFDNGLLVKLPEENVDKAWEMLIEVLSEEGSFDKIKIIDLRIMNKIFLGY